MGPYVVTKLTLQLPVPMKKDLDNLMVIFSIKSNATKIIRFFPFLGFCPPTVYPTADSRKLTSFEMMVKMMAVTVGSVNRLFTFAQL